MCIWHFDSFTQTLSDQEDVCHHPLLLKKLNLSEILKEKNADLKLCQDRNGRILFNHLPGCNRSSSPPICTFGCVEFAAAIRRRSGEDKQICWEVTWVTWRHSQHQQRNEISPDVPQVQELKSQASVLATWLPWPWVQPSLQPLLP